MKKKLSVFIDIAGYLFLFFLFFFLFCMPFEIELSLDSIPPAFRSEGDIAIFNLRKLLVFVFCLFFTSTVDFMAVAKLLTKLKMGKYKKVIFILCLTLSLVLFIMLMVFRNMYPL